MFLDNIYIEKTIKVELGNSFCSGIKVYAELDTETKINKFAEDTFREKIIMFRSSNCPYILGLLKQKEESKIGVAQCSWRDGQELCAEVVEQKVKAEVDFFILHPTSSCFVPLSWSPNKISRYFGRSKKECIYQLALHCFTLSHTSPEGVYYLKTLHNFKVTLNIAEKMLSSIASLIPQEGIIKEIKDNLVYVKVNDCFVKYLHPFLAAKGYEEAPFFADRIVRNQLVKGAGAHISLINKNEILEKKPSVESYLDEKVAFTTKELKIVKPEKWRGVHEAVIIEVACSRLSEIRRSLDLEELINGHQFHITIAIHRKDLQFN